MHRLLHFLHLFIINTVIFIYHTIFFSLILSPNEQRSKWGWVWTQSPGYNGRCWLICNVKRPTCRGGAVAVKELDAEERRSTSLSEVDVWYAQITSFQIIIIFFFFFLLTCNDHDLIERWLKHRPRTQRLSNNRSLVFVLTGLLMFLVGYEEYGNLPFSAFSGPIVEKPYLEPVTYFSGNYHSRV